MMENVVLIQRYSDICDEISNVNVRIFISD